MSASYNNGSDEKKQSYDEDDEDDCYQETLIDEKNDRREAICEKANVDDGIIQCIGSLRIQYANKKKLTKPPETSIGTGTIIKIDEQNRCYVLTVAHNVCQRLRECKSCGKRTIMKHCRKCNQRTSQVKPPELIKPTSIEFIRRCTVPKKHDNNTGREYIFGDVERVGEIDKYYIPEILYNLWISPRAGYDIAILVFKCHENDIQLFKNVCSRIQLKCDKTFGGIKNRLFLYGYPKDKYQIRNNITAYQMYGMSTGMDGVFTIEKHKESNKSYIINDKIDTQPGQSGSCIWSYDPKNKQKYIIYGVHSGGIAADINKGRKFGINYGTFLDEENLDWIERICNLSKDVSLLESSFENDEQHLLFEQIQNNQKEVFLQQLQKIQQRHQQELERLKAENVQMHLLPMPNTNVRAESFFDIEMRFNRQEHGDNLTFLSDSIVRKEKDNIWSICLFGDTITDKMCTQFEIDIKLLNEGKFQMGYVFSSIINWDKLFGEHDNANCSIGYGVYKSWKYFYQYKKDSNKKLNYRAPKYMTSNDTFRFLFNFGENRLTIYHNGTEAEKLQFDYKQFTFGFALANENTSLEVTKYKFHK